MTTTQTKQQDLDALVKLAWDMDEIDLTDVLTTFDSFGRRYTLPVDQAYVATEQWAVLHEMPFLMNESGVTIERPGSYIWMEYQSNIFAAVCAALEVRRDRRSN